MWRKWLSFLLLFEGPSRQFISLLDTVQAIFSLTILTSKRNRLPEPKFSKEGPCCCCSVAQSCPAVCNPMGCSMAGLSVPHHLPKFAQVHVHCIGDAIQISHPLLPLFFCLQSSQASGSFPMSQQFASGGQCIRDSASVLTKSIQGWFPLRLTALISLLQGTLRSPLQHHSSKALIIWHSTFFTVQLSQPYMTTGKNIALAIQTYVGWK